MVMGEIPVLDAEAETVMSRLFAAGMTVSAFHNHRIAMSPQVWWVHFSGMGAATSLAAGLRQALPGSGSVFASGTSSSSSPINAVQLKSILGGDTKNSGNGVVEVMVDRTDQIFMNGMLIPSAMGVDEHFYFQPLSGGRVAAVGELALRAEEVPAVTRVIRQYQMDITALHNHMLTEQPRLFFLHTWAVGNAVQIARAHRAAINYANTERP
jgi:hypothetical protein